MQRFEYEGFTADGGLQRGTLTAESRADASARLRRDAIVATTLREAQATTLRPAHSRPSGRSVLEFSRAMAALLAAGMQPARALDATRALVDAAAVATLGDVRARVARGEAISDALAAQPGWFPTHAVGLVRAGERSGDLAEAFTRLTAMLERQAALRERLLTAAIYPSILVVAGGAAMLVLLLAVLPNFATLLGDAGLALPRSTAMLLGVATFLRRSALPLGAVVIVMGLAAVWALRRREARLASMAMLDRMPLLGVLLRDVHAARFARVTGTLLKGGAPLLGALTDATTSLDGTLAHAGLLRVRAAVRDGSSLAGALQREPRTPEALVQLVALGEESSRLDEFLLRSADVLEDRVDRALQRLVVLVEPALIVVFGSVVGFTALALLQAVYGVNAGATL